MSLASRVIALYNSNQFHVYYTVMNHRIIIIKGNKDYFILFKFTFIVPLHLSSSVIPTGIHYTLIYPVFIIFSVASPVKLDMDLIIKG